MRRSGRSHVLPCKVGVAPGCTLKTYLGLAPPCSSTAWRTSGDAATPRARSLACSAWRCLADLLVSPPVRGHPALVQAANTLCHIVGTLPVALVACGCDQVPWGVAASTSWTPSSGSPATFWSHRFGISCLHSTSWLPRDHCVLGGLWSLSPPFSTTRILSCPLTRATNSSSACCTLVCRADPTE